MMSRRMTAGLILTAAWLSPAAAKVEQIEILSRQPFAAGTEFGSAGAYEKLRGRAWFALDPNAAANAPIADLKLAPRNNRGLVIFSSDFLVLRPVDAARGNGLLLYEVNNRGNIGMLGQLNEAPFSRNDPATRCDAGNGFLFRRGFTMVWSAWAADVAISPGDNRLVLTAPVATNAGVPITGKVAYDLTVDTPRPSARFTGNLGTAYPLADDAASDATLTERDRPEGERRSIPRAAWSFVVPGGGGPATEIRLDGGFKPGRIYQLVYTARDPIVVALGMAGIRDLMSYLRDNPLAGAPTPRKNLIFGISQSGRLIQTMLLRGLNADEDGKPVFDGAFIHVAGGGKGGFDYRFAMPTRHFSMLEDHIYPTDFFPFATVTARDPVTGAEGSVLDRAARARRGAEAVLRQQLVGILEPRGIVDRHGSGGRARPAAGARGAHLSHRRRAALRRRACASAAIFANCVNTLNHYRVMRALMVALRALGGRRRRAAAEHLSAHRRRHAGHGRRLQGDVPAHSEFSAAGEQPASAAPRPRRPVRDASASRTTCRRSWASHSRRWCRSRTPTASTRVASRCRKCWCRSAPAPASTPATRPPASPGPPAAGTARSCRSPRTEAERQAAGDPRPSIAARYRDRAAYSDKVRAAAAGVVDKGFLLPDDVDALVQEAGGLYDRIMAHDPADPSCHYLSDRGHASP